MFARGWLCDAAMVLRGNIFMDFRGLLNHYFCLLTELLDGTLLYSLHGASGKFTIKNTQGRTPTMRDCIGRVLS